MVVYSSRLGAVPFVPFWPFVTSVGHIIVVIEMFGIMKQEEFEV
jgi:hypothetical protein